MAIDPDVEQRLSRVLTLILPVLALCAVLGFGYRDWSTGREQNRQRLQDMISLRQGLARYFADHGVYPAAPNNAECDGTFGNAAGLGEDLTPKYLDQVPRDPNPSSCRYDYLYSSDLKNYIILVHLSGADDGWCIGAAAGMIDVYKNYAPCP